MPLLWRVFDEVAGRKTVTQTFESEWIQRVRGYVGRVGDDDVPEAEPDYRFTLANERTFLAWQRTALGLLAAAVAVVQLVPELSIAGARHVLGIILALLAILTAGMGILRWQQVDRAMRRGLPLPRHPTPMYLGIGLVAIGLLTVCLVVVKAMS